MTNKKAPYRCKHRTEGSARPHRKGCTPRSDTGRCQHTSCCQQRLQEVDTRCCFLICKGDTGGCRISKNTFISNFNKANKHITVISLKNAPVQEDMPLQVALMASWHLVPIFSNVQFRQQGLFLSLWRHVKACVTQTETTKSFRPPQSII